MFYKYSLLKIFKINNCRFLSRILFLPLVRDSHHLSTTGIAANLYLPTHEHWTSSPQSFTYLAFQHVRFTPQECCHPACELLPHIFTLTPTRNAVAVIFCGTVFLPLLAGPPVRWYVALYCPDFPPFTQRERRWLNLQSFAKLRISGLASDTFHGCIPSEWQECGCLHCCLPG